MKPYSKVARSFTLFYAVTTLFSCTSPLTSNGEEESSKNNGQEKLFLSQAFCYRNGNKGNTVEGGKIMSVLHHLTYLRRAKLERKESSEVEFPSAHLHPAAQECRIPPLQTHFWRSQFCPRENTVLQLWRKRLISTNTTTLCQMSALAVQTCWKHTGRLPLTADRRQLHSSPSSAWMPSTITEREQRCHMLWPMLLTPLS